MKGDDKKLLELKILLLKDKYATNLLIELVFQSHFTALEVCNQVLQMTSDLNK